MPGAGADGGRRHGAQCGQVWGTAGCTVQPGTGWSRAVPCSSREKGVSACPQPPVPQPLALFLSPSVPLCPGGRSSLVADDGWNTVPIRKGNRPIDTSRLTKITKVTLGGNAVGLPGPTVLVQGSELTLFSAFSLD